MRINFKKLNAQKSKIPNTESPYGSRTFLREEKGIHTCSKCGTKWLANNIKHSYSCPFCGESLLGNTTMEELPLPDYIIPFKLSREEAADKIRQAFNRRHFIPKKVRYFSIDEIHGFFLPYWLYDIDYSSEAKWSFRKYRFPTGNSVLEVYATTSHANFEHFSIAACESFSREYAKHIEPYNLAELVPYDNNLTNGYYSAHFDTPAKRAKAVALDRIQDMMIKKVRIAVNEIPHFEPMTYRGLFENALRYNINYEEYALLPVWYYRVVCRGHTYIAIANGQTGKVELDLPTGKPRLIRNVLLLFLMNSVLFLFLAEAAAEFSSLEITPTQWYGLGLLCNLAISFLFAKLFSLKHGPIGEDEVTAEDFNTEFDIKFHDDW